MRRPSPRSQAATLPLRLLRRSPITSYRSCAGWRRLLQKPHVRHSRAGGNPFSISGQDWIPAFAGMTRTGRSRVCATASAGRVTEQLADELEISVHTVRNHLRNARRKLGARSRLAAVVTAMRQGVLESPRERALRLGGCVPCDDSGASSHPHRVARRCRCVRRTAATRADPRSGRVVARAPGGSNRCRRFPPAGAVTPGEHDRHFRCAPELPAGLPPSWPVQLLGAAGQRPRLKPFRKATADGARCPAYAGVRVELEALVAAAAGLADARQAFAKGPILPLQVAGPGHALPRSEPGCWTPEGVAPPRVARRVAIQVARQQIQAGCTTVSTAPVCL